MNIDIWKKAAIISLILGAALGFLTIIPYINFFSFMALIFLAAPAVIVCMKSEKLLGIIDTREGAMWGAAIGFIVFTAFFVVFVPLSALIGIFYKEGIYITMKLFCTSNGGIVVLIMTFIMLGVLNALFNAFSGLFTAYIYLQKDNIKKEQNQSFQIDNKG